MDHIAYLRNSSFAQSYDYTITLSKGEKNHIISLLRFEWSFSVCKNISPLNTQMYCAKVCKRRN